MKIPLYKQVALLKDYPEEGLLAGDVVTTVEFLESPSAEVPNGYFVEAFSALGKTIAVFIVYEDDIEALTDQDILHVRDSIPPASKIIVLDEETMDKEPLAITAVSPDAIMIELSDELLGQKGATREDFKLQLALFLFQQDLYSLGKASELTGLHPIQFQKELAKREIPVHYDENDYQQDANTLDNYMSSSHTTLLK